MKSSVLRIPRAFAALPLVLALFLGSPLLAQSTASGAVSGEILAPDGTVVPAASITLENPDGPSYTASSDPGGAFSIPNLTTGGYILHVKAPGFAPYDQPGVSVAIGRTTHLSVHLSLATASQNVTVTANQTTFDPSQTSSVVNIDRDRVEELPIPSRNYLTFVGLSPQVAPMNPALAQHGLAPSSAGFSFGGLRPGSNAVYLDDTNDNDEYLGGSRTQLSPEAINDFQIVNHGFSAQAGGGSGGSIDVETRVGLNRVHGDAFAFVQNGALNATPALELVPRKPDESRERFGLSQGGPLQHDKMYYYWAAEVEHARGEEANDLSPALVTSINSTLAQGGPLAGLSLRTGFFPTTDGETELSARIDRTLTPRHSLMLRYALTNSRSVNDAFHTDDLTDYTSRGSSFVDDNSLNGMLTSSLGTAVLNRFSFELAQRHAVDRTVDASTPGVLIPGVVRFGTPYFGNARRFEVHTEFADTLSLQKKRHLITAGLRGDRVALRTSVLDGARGLYVFPTLADFQARRPEMYTQTFGNLDQDLTEVRLDAFLQDHWTATRTLTLDYGLRYDANLLPTPFPRRVLDFAPRIGLAWTPNRTLVVRSGFGLFFDRFLMSTATRVLDQDGTKAFTQIVEGPAAAGLFSGSPITKPLVGVAPSIWRFQPGLPSPYSAVASLSAEQQLPLQTTLTAEYQHVRGIHLGRTTNINLPAPVTLTAANAASLGFTTPDFQQLAQPVFGPSRLNSAYDAINQFATSAASTYDGATLSLNRQFQDDVEILAGYTFSKTTDDASSDLEQPQNPYNLRGERGPSLMDQRQRFTLSGLWLIGPDMDDPADAAKAANPGPFMKAVTGFEFTPILSITSGFRANPLTGFDSSHEHIYPFAARPAGFGRNSLTTPANINLDLRVLRIIPVWRGHIDVVAESFNLLNHQNVSILNTAFGTGPTPQPNFNHPIQETDARRVQFSLDFEY